MKKKAIYLPGINLKLNLAASVMLLLLMSVAVGGATYAWFTRSSAAIVNEFTAGTVKLTAPVDDISPSAAVYTVYVQGDGECQTVGWTFDYTGSKKAYVRVKPGAIVSREIFIAIHLEVNDETAWVGVPGSEFLPIPGGSAWNQYFKYPLGVYDADSPGQRLELGILAGSNFTPVGTAFMWDDGTALYFRFQAYDGQSMEKIHIYAGLTPPTDHTPGQLGWERTVDPPGESYTFDTPDVYPNQNAAAPNVSIESLYGGVDISLCSNTPGWVEDAGWWYFGDAAGPTVVGTATGVTKLAVCFTFCVVTPPVTLRVWLEAEAVQASHNAIDIVWPGHPFP
ncbi:MAG TPA: hypothetical protein VLH18_01180 [Candidatus Limnocylindrales bacterium]|nr:hypothetical protein [Candidatus Limnocylindrales bacterium]